MRTPARAAYTTLHTPDERGRMVWAVIAPDGAMLRHASQYRGDAGRIRKFRSEQAAAAYAAERNRSR